ncbi:PspC family transcriptional regulator [Actinomadura sp. NBRC 104425]|uniref:PspC domain-containing protein n=1 Tax=Actinomadura sp. NBRC 104425 TaxID=3032204 RepID=UPI0024A52754|nr:PspC domain-containing protein [Actinomadura sp. NBRC 104425]GLZ12206.1 PspC family transcriptional regulator [Actinomadura sp. NBRC 104425]
MTDERTVTERPTAAADGRTRLFRGPERRILAGVCTGLGRHLGVDPVVLRVAFAVLTLTGGQGVWLYAAGVLLMPGSPEEDAPAEKLLHRRFDAAGVLSIMGALLCVTTGFQLVGGWVSSNTIAVLTVVGLVLLVAHARGVDFMAAVRAMPERVQGHPMDAPAPPVGDGVSLRKDTRDDTVAAPGGGLPAGMVDLAVVGARHRAAPGPDSPVDEPPPRKTPPAEAGKKMPPVTAVTLLAALAVGAATVPVVRAYPGPDAALIAGSAALGVVAVGLVLGGWFNVRGLAPVGTLLTFALLTTSVVAEAPRDLRYGSVEWRPADSTRISDEYKVGVGSARLDLSGTRFSPGQRVTVSVQVTMGELKVTVPRTARVELDARVALGDLQVDGHTVAGPGARAVEVLEPEVSGRAAAPVIELRVRGRFGHVEVTRA